MKSTLLTTTALIAFAGASYADGHTSVSFSGEAGVKSNSVTGVTTKTELTATASAALDNGMTAETSVTFDAVAGTFSAGSVSLSSDTASLTFGNALDGAAFTAIGDDYAIGAGEEGVSAAAGEIGAVATYTMGATELTVSMPLDAPTSNDLEVGVTTSAAGWDLGLGLSGAGDYGVQASGTVGGADLNFGMDSNSDWDAGIGFTAGAITLSASTDEDSAWTVGADYDGGAFSAGLEYNSDSTWKASGGYDANGIVVAGSLDNDSVVTLGATYDMGNGLTVGAGIENAANDPYAFAEYDLGGGASAFVDYTALAGGLAEVGPSERDIAEGTTVGVSFTF